MANRSRTPALSRFVWAVVIVLILLAHPSSAHADIIRGLLRIVGGVMAIPTSTLAGTFSGPPIVGTLVGALSGTLNGIGMVAGGALETLISAIPFAEKAAPFIPIFF